MKRAPRWIVSLVVLAVAYLSFVWLRSRLTGTLGAQSPPPGRLVCTVIGERNDGTGVAHVMLQLANGYDSSLLVGLDAVEALTPSGWERVSEGQGEVLAGVVAGGTKVFSHPKWHSHSVWRLRLIYSPPSTVIRSATAEVMVRLRGSWRDAVTVTSPEIHTDRPSNKSVEPTATRPSASGRRRD